MISTRMPLGRRRHSIRTRLFATYSTLIVATLIGFGLIFWLYTSHVLSTRTTASLETLTTSLNERLDEEVRNMDAVSLSVALANLRQSQRSLPETEAAGTSSRVALEQTLTSILGPFQSVRELYVHDENGTTTGVGLYSGTLRSPGQPDDWNKTAEALLGKMYISLPHRDPLIEREIPIYRNHLYVSLSREFFDPFGKPLGVAEVEQDAGLLFENFTPPGTNGAGTEVIVYNRDGEPMYPPATETGNYFAHLRDLKAKEAQHHSNDLSGSYRSRAGGEPDVLAYSTSSYTGLTVVAVEPASYVFGPVYTFTRILISGGLLAILAVLVISYVLARRLTIPIKRLHGAILALDGERLFTAEPQRFASSLNELEELNLAFQTMHVTLRDSVNDLIALRSHEALTRMLALQSQLRPHFLYNTLANISAMAENHMTGEIVKLCRDLSSMYHYIGEGFSNLVAIRDEIEFTRTYVACMAFRFDVAIRVRFEIDDDVMALQIPKLTVQPLVENVLKYAVVAGRDIETTVSARAEGDGWVVTVCDNGPGFSSKALETIAARMRRVETDDSFESYGAESVGLPNIYSRLRILYGDCAKLAIGRDESGGASVAIRGLQRVRFGA